ncbi:hypothetical protein L9F63_002125, partial [Diploptera punctata]
HFSKFYIINFIFIFPSRWHTNWTNNKPLAPVRDIRYFYFLKFSISTYRGMLHRRNRAENRHFLLS